MSLDVLVVDDEQDIRDLISDILKDDGYNPRVANNSTSAIEAIDERMPSAMVLDIWLQGSELDGLGILESVKRKYPNLPVVMISGHGNIDTAISSIKLGAYDYIEKPFKEDRLLLLLKRAIEAAKLKEENTQLKAKGTFENQLIGSSNAVVQLKNIIDKVAQTESRIMISGPSGCGKEVVARAIHEKSHRSSHPFVILNAAGISPQNFEVELFGEEDKTGLSGGERKVGIFEKAHGGTVFIDEVADMPLATQGKLLKILQEKSFQRIGGKRRIEVDVRVIAATAKDLQKLISEGKFREDLFYRLNVVPINVPSLKERREDLLPLTKYFIRRCSNILGLPKKEISEGAIASMERYSWPGNVRQLRNVIENLLIMSKGQDEAIRPSMLPPEILSDNPVMAKADDNADIMGLPLRAAREMFEKQYLAAQLERFGGNISRTASFIGMERSAFHRKLKLLNMHSNNDDGDA